MKQNIVRMPAQRAPAAPARGLGLAPVHKRALGVAAGSVLGAAVFLVTVFHVVVRPAEALDIGLLAEYFYGYRVTWTGAFVGLFWGFVTGFVFGWFGAFMRNLVVAISLFTLRARAEIAQARNFLDHI